MIRIFLVLIALLIFPTVICRASEEFQNLEVTGDYWDMMTDAEQIDYVSISLGVLSSLGVGHAGSPRDYLEAIGVMLDKNPELYPDSVTNILASAIYEKEPENRGALDKIRKPKV